MKWRRPLAVGCTRGGKGVRFKNNILDIWLKAFRNKFGIAKWKSLSGQLKKFHGVGTAPSYTVHQELSLVIGQLPSQLSRSANIFQRDNHVKLVECMQKVMGFSSSNG